MPVTSSIEWKPLRDSHYVVAALQPGGGGLRHIFVRQSTLSEVQTIALRDPEPPVVGLLLGERLDCALTLAPYVVIETHVEVALASFDERTIADAIRTLRSRVGSHDSIEVLGWFCSGRTPEPAVSRMHAALHSANFTESWQTVLTFAEGGRIGSFFLHDARAARWFHAPFYEVTDSKAVGRAPKPTSVAWPPYITTAPVVPLADIPRQVQPQTSAASGSSKKRSFGFPQSVVKAPRAPGRDAVVGTRATADTPTRSPLDLARSLGDRVLSVGRHATERIDRIRAKRAADVAHQKAEADAAQAREDAKRAKEVAERRAAREEAQRKAAEAQKQRAAEAEVRRVAEAEARRIAAEEAERRRAIEAEEQRKVAAEAERRRAIEDEKRRKAEEEADRRRAIEAEEQRKVAEEAERKRAIEAGERRKAAAEADRLRAIEAEERRKAEAEADRLRAIEIEAQRQAAEAEARRQAEQAEAQRAAEAEAKRKAAEEAQRQVAEAERLRAIEIEARRQAAEAEARRQAEAAELRRVAEAESIRKAAEEVLRKAAEAEARRAAAEEAKRQAVEEERRRVAEAEARQFLEAAEAEARRKAAETREDARRRAAEVEVLRISVEVAAMRQRFAGAPIEGSRREKPKSIVAPLADVDETHVSDAQRYIALAKREGFEVSEKIERGTYEKPETVWLLHEPQSGLRLIVVTTDHEVRDASLHYNLRATDDALLRTTPPEYCDLESRTIYGREACLHDLRARCKRLRATGALERDWKVSPTHRHSASPDAP